MHTHTEKTMLLSVSMYVLLRVRSSLSFNKLNQSAPRGVTNRSSLYFDIQQPALLIFVYLSVYVSISLSHPVHLYLSTCPSLSRYLAYSILFDSLRFDSTLPCAILFYSTLRYSILFYPTLFYSILSYSILLYAILSILLYSILFYSILF